MTPTGAPGPAGSDRSAPWKRLTKRRLIMIAVAAVLVAVVMIEVRHAVDDSRLDTEQSTPIS